MKSHGLTHSIVELVIQPEFYTTLILRHINLTKLCKCKYASTYVARVGEGRNKDRERVNELVATFTEAPANMGILRVISSRSRDKGDLMVKYALLVTFARTSTCKYSKVIGASMYLSYSLSIFLIIKEIWKSNNS